MKREKIFRVKNSDYYIRIYEDDAGKVYAEDSYSTEEGKLIEFSSWDEAASQAEAIIKENQSQLAPLLLPLSDGDIAHYGITDLYPEAKKNLCKMLLNGQNFDTGWGTSKKELISLRIEGIGNTLQISVCQEMDDFPEIIYDALFELEIDSEDCFTEDDLSVITNLIIADGMFENPVYETDTLPRNSSYETVMETVSRLSDATDISIKKNFEIVKSYVCRYKE